MKLIQKFYPSYRMIKLTPKYVAKMGLISFFKFAIYSRISDSFQRYRTNNCKYPIYLRGKTSDMFAFEQIFISEEYNIDFKVKKAPIIIDGGSNCGHSILYFKTRFPRAKIIGIEPEETNFRIASKNCKKLSGVDLLNCGLWYKDTHLEVVEGSLINKNWGSRVIENSEGNLKALSIDSLISSYNLEYVDILKIDIEGSEYEIFKKSYGCNWPTLVNYIIVEPHEQLIIGCKEQILTFAKKFGMEIKYKGENFILERKII